MINPPNISVSEVLRTIEKYYISHRKSGVHVRNTFQVLAGDFSVFVNAEHEYRKKALNHQLCDFSDDNEQNDSSRENAENRQDHIFCKNEMMRFYDLLRSVKFEDHDVSVYKCIMENANDDMCPYCRMERIQELDHFLPKSIFYQFAITPINLVPICLTCNSIAHKGDKYPKRNGHIEDYILHPYFFDIYRYEWLTAEIETLSDRRDDERITLSIKLNPRRPAEISENDYQRYLDHYRVLKINERLSPKLVSVLNNYKITLKKYYERGALELKNYINVRCEEMIECEIVDSHRLVFMALRNNENTVEYIARWISSGS